MTFKAPESLAIPRIVVCAGLHLSAQAVWLEAL